MLRRQVGRRGYGQDIPRLVGVSLARHNLYVARLAPTLAARHECYLAHRQPVYYGYGQGAHARLVLHVEDRAVDIHAVGVGTVEDDHLVSGIGTCVDHAQHGDVVGIEPQPHILHIDYQQVECLHCLLRGALRTPVVERPYWYAGLLVDRTLDMFASVGAAAETVFG